jgi:cation:H+ antiporter
MIIAFVAVMLAGFTGMVLASQRAVGSATELAAGTNLPPFFVGMTLLAVGTDLPEIANSIIASLADHGDVNVGDSVGSAATQATLILGLLPIIAGALAVPKRGIASTGSFAVVGLIVIAVVTADGNLGRSDGALLLALWAAGSWFIYHRATYHQQLALPKETAPRLILIMRTLGAMIIVAGSAMASLWGIIGIADELDAPEFLVSFFLASLGTSLPELAFGLTAIRAGAVAMAIGDLCGASFIDATLSVGIGPLVSPTEVTYDEIGPAVIAAIVAVAIVTVIMTRIETHDWRTGSIMVGLYAAFFAVLL